MTGKKGRNGEVSEVITGEWLERMGGELQPDRTYKFVLDDGSILGNKIIITTTHGSDIPVKPYVNIGGEWQILHHIRTTRDFSGLYFRLSGKRLEVVKNE